MRLSRLGGFVGIEVNPIMATHSRSHEQATSVGPAKAPLSGVQPGLAGAFSGGGTDVPAQIAAQAATVHELRVELNQLRVERDRLADRQRQIAELLNSANPEKIVHDLRNVLNELTLYKALVDVQDA
jgi:hypothetical protein